MNRSLFAARLVAVLSLALAGVACGPDAPTTPTPSAAVVGAPTAAHANAGGVTIAEPASTRLHPGDKIQLTATVVLPNGKDKDKFPIKWSTSSAAVATVDEKTGEVTAVAPGAVTITAKAGPRNGQLALTVIVPVARVTLSPDSPYLTWNSRVGATVTLTATALDASGNPISDLDGRLIVWASDDTTTATVAATDKPGQGLVTDVRVGKATISATVDGVRGTARLTVEPQSGFIAGTTNTAGGIPALSVGESVPLRMYFVDDNNIVVPIDDTQLGPKSWVSVNPAVATVSATGVATGVALGDTEIRGTYRGFTVRDPIFVVSVASIEVYIMPKTLRVGETVQAAAVVRDPQGSILLDKVVTWRTAPTGQAEVASVDRFGRVTGEKEGVTQIIANVEGKEGSLEVPVLPAAVASVRILTMYPTLTVGETGTLTAATFNADGIVLPGHAVTWTTNNPSAVAISGTTNDGAGGTATIRGVGVGSTTVVATSEGKSDSVTVTVTPTEPNAPSGLNISFNRTAPFTYSSHLTWNDNSNNEDEFQVERAVGGTSDFTLNDRVPGSNNAQGVSNVADNFAELTLYTYRVHACIAAGGAGQRYVACYASSPTVSIPGPLREPTNLVAVRDGSGVRLTWQDNTTKEDMYVVVGVLVHPDGTTTGMSRANLAPNTTEYLAPGGASGTTFYYSVVACASVTGYGNSCSFAATSQQFTF
jgi:uncharacterized protein YjdB